MDGLSVACERAGVPAVVFDEGHADVRMYVRTYVRRYVALTRCDGLEEQSFPLVKVLLTYKNDPNWDNCTDANRCVG